MAFVLQIKVFTTQTSRHLIVLVSKCSNKREKRTEEIDFTFIFKLHRKYNFRSKKCFIISFFMFVHCVTQVWPPFVFA